MFGIVVLAFAIGLLGGGTIIHYDRKKSVDLSNKVAKDANGRVNLFNERVTKCERFIEAEDLMTKDRNHHYFQLEKQVQKIQSVFDQMIYKTDTKPVTINIHKHYKKSKKLFPEVTQPESTDALTQKVIEGVRKRVAANKDGNPKGVSSRSFARPNGRVE